MLCDIFQKLPTFRPNKLKAFIGTNWHGLSCIVWL